MQNLLVKTVENSGNAISDMVANNAPTTIAITAVGATAAIIDFKLIVIVLFCLMVADFITGIMASYKEYQDRHNIRFHKACEYAKNWCRIVQSSKLKKSGVKFMLYAGTIVIAYVFENLLFIKGFSIGISEANFTLSVVVTIFWWLVEIHSIVFENFRRMGFSIIKKVKTIKDDVNEIKDNINDIKS